MRLGTINAILHRVGLVLVVSYPTTLLDETPTRIWIERKSTYDKRCHRQAS